MRYFYIYRAKTSALLVVGTQVVLVATHNGADCLALLLYVKGRIYNKNVHPNASRKPTKDNLVANFDSQRFIFRLYSATTPTQNKKADLSRLNLPIPTDSRYSHQKTWQA